MKLPPNGKIAILAKKQGIVINFLIVAWVWSIIAQPIVLRKTLFRLGVDAMAPSGFNNDLAQKRAKERMLGEQLDEQGFSEELKGKRVVIPPKNFSTCLDKNIQSYWGAPEYAIRARKMEDAIERLMKRLAVEYANMIDIFGAKPEVFNEKWKDVINSIELNELNELIEIHNKYYPLEAELRIDPNTGNYLTGSSVWEKQKMISKEELIRQFPFQY